MMAVVLLLQMAEREMHRLLQFLLSMQMHRFLLFSSSVAAKLAGEEDGKRLRKNDGGGVDVAAAVDAVSKLREEKRWLVRKVGGGAPPPLFSSSSVIFSLVPLFLCWFRFFSVLSLSFHPQNPLVRSSLSHQNSIPYLYPTSVFIGAGREGHRTPAMTLGKVATLPMSLHRVGWLVMACINGGRILDVACVSGQLRRARQIGRIARKDLKSSSSLHSI